MYIFRPEHLVLNDQLSCSSLQKTINTIPPNFICPYLPVVYFVGLGPSGFFSVRVNNREKGFQTLKNNKFKGVNSLYNEILLL